MTMFKYPTKKTLKSSRKECDFKKGKIPENSQKGITWGSPLIQSQNKKFSPKINAKEERNTFSSQEKVSQISAKG